MTSGAPSEALDVILRDGTTLRLRPPRAKDEKALLEFFGELSDPGDAVLLRGGHEGRADDDSVREGGDLGRLFAGAHAEAHADRQVRVRAGALDQARRCGADALAGAGHRLALGCSRPRGPQP